MTGRRVASLFAITVGVISFFLPLVMVSAPRLNEELRWSGFTVTSEMLGLTSEHFYDIAAVVVYGSEDTSAAGQSGSTVSAVQESSRSESADASAGGYAALVGIGALVLAYLILVLVFATVLLRYSPSWVSVLSIIGFLSATVGLIATLITVDRMQAVGFSAERALVRLDIGYGQFLLIAAFMFLIIFQRLRGVDRLLSPSS